MTIAQLYDKLNKNEISKSHFLKEARLTFPQWITSVSSFDDTLTILKNKNIIKECECEMKEEFGENDMFVSEKFGEEPTSKFSDIQKYVDTAKKQGYITLDEFFNEIPDDMEQAEKAQILYKLSDLGLLYSGNGEEEFGFDDVPDGSNKLTHEDIDKVLDNTSGIDTILGHTKSSLNEGKNDVSSIDKKANYSNFNILDRVSHEEYIRGLHCEKEAGKDLEAAKKIVLKNLTKDPIYYTNKLAGVDNRRKRKDIMTPVKKDNFIDKSNGLKKIKDKESNSSATSKKESFKHIKVKELTYKPLRAKGIKGTMELPGKEKKVKLKEELLKKAIKSIIKEVFVRGVNFGGEESSSMNSGSRDKIKTFIKKAENAGGVVYNDAIAELKDYDLPEDLIQKILYYLVNKDLMNDMDGNLMSTQDLDNELHTYMYDSTSNQPKNLNEEKKKKTLK